MIQLGWLAGVLRAVTSTDRVTPPTDLEIATAREGGCETHLMRPEIENFRLGSALVFEAFSSKQAWLV